jgi:hypothetical protein
VMLTLPPPLSTMILLWTAARLDGTEDEGL